MMRFVPMSLVVVVLSTGCVLVLPKETRYLRHAQDRSSQAEVAQILGRPLITATNADGNTLWVYHVREQEAGNRWTSTGLWCDEYVLIFDDHSILRGWTHKSEFHGGELMPTYCVAGGATLPIAVKPKIGFPR